MPDPLRIKLNRLDPAAYLESAGGTVITTTGQSRLDGPFVLVVAGQHSDPLTFNATTLLAKVAASGQDWILQSLAKTNFRFGGAPLLLADGSGPWLSCRLCWLIQPSTSGAMALLSLDDSRASLTASGGDPGPGAIVYPSQAGDQSQVLSMRPHPETPSWVGYFVLPFEGGHIVHLGVLRQRISINHSVATDILVQDDSSILFPVPRAGMTQTSLLIDSPTGTVGAHVRAAANSNLMMAQVANVQNWTRLRMPTSRIEVSAGWLRVKKFRDEELWLGHVTDTAQPLAESIALFTATNRLSYEIELAPVRPSVRFIYNDNSIASGVPPTRAERFYGLRLKGLGSRDGIRPALDAHQLWFNLTNDANPRFHVKSGITPGSVLVPKRNPRSASGARVLDIPVSSQLSLRVDAPAKTTETTMQLDTEQGKFIMNSPSLLSAPAGITSKETGAAQDARYASWALKPDGEADVMFTLSETGLKPAEDWLNQFHTSDPSAKYGLIEHPGTQLAIDGPPSRSLAARLAKMERKQTEITHKQAGGKEWIAYSAFFATLSWFGVQCASDGLARCLDEKRFKVSFPQLDDEAYKKFVKRNGLQDLQIVYNTAAYPDAGDQIHDFVDDNMTVGEPPPEKFLWPFAAGLSILLYDQKDPNGPYADEIAAARRKPNKNNTCIAFDLSAETALNPVDLGYTTTSTPKWSDLPVESPALWPRGSGRGGARLDPTDKLWRGVFLRDLPLILPAPPIVGEEFPFLQRLIDGINKKLMLDYGWRDESGPTWFANLKQTFDDGLFTPDNWKGFLEMSLLSVVLKGASGAVVTAEATCAIRLNRLTDKTTGKPLEFQATFGLDLTSGGNPITRIDITQEGRPIETDSLPGFSSVALRRIATDFKTAQFELLLTATPALANALPFLSSTKPQAAFLSFNLKGEPTYTLSLALPKEFETNLFGRWPLTVQAISVQFAKDPNVNTVELRIRGRLHLGVAAFASVGATIVIKRDAGGVHFNVEVDSISGSLKVGSVKISGSFEWRDGKGNSGIVDLTGAASAGRARDLWGAVVVEDPGVLGKNMLAVRIGNQGEVSFWIATISVGTDIPIGIGRLKNPALLLAHNADFGGSLEKVVTDPTASLLQVLRPDFSNEGTIDEWLAKWQPSATIGSVIAGSGYVQFQSGIADAPVKDNTPVTDPSQLSSLLFTDRGLFRIDGVLMMLGTLTMRFGLAIDYQKRRILAGLQAPTFKLPDPNNPQYEIQAGYITVGVSFSGADPWLRVSVGWPERIGGTEFERDWSKATKVYVSTMWPINTFWGGYLAELQRGRIVFGFAIRAGWTWSAKASIGGIIAGDAELGITLGGVFQFAITWDGAFRDNNINTLPRALSAKTTPLPLLDETVSADSPFASHANTIFRSLESFDASLEDLSRVDLAMSAEIFGDIWGKASVKFIGITLAAISVRAYARFRVCGSFHQGITQAKAQVGFDVSVTILCVTFHASAEIDITLKDGPCPLFDAPNLFFIPGEAPSVLPLPSDVILLQAG